MCSLGILVNSYYTKLNQYKHAADKQAVIWGKKRYILVYCRNNEFVAWKWGAKKLFMFVNCYLSLHFYVPLDWSSNLKYFCTNETRVIVIICRMSCFISTYKVILIDIQLDTISLSESGIFTVKSPSVNTYRSISQENGEVAKCVR